MNEEKEKVLEVKDLTVSFQTYAGKVQAVRKSSFDLYKKETLDCRRVRFGEISYRKNTDGTPGKDGCH